MQELTGEYLRPNELYHLFIHLLDQNLSYVLNYSENERHYPGVKPLEINQKTYTTSAKYSGNREQSIPASKQKWHS